MRKSIALILAMAERCREIITESTSPAIRLPPSLNRSHLEWMCQQIIEHADEWPETKAHRWIGFLQGALIANEIINLDAAKRLFDQAKIEYAEPDPDLLDHLNPASLFEIELGGQG